MDKGLLETKERLTKELVDYAKVKDISIANLDVIYKTVKSIYYLTTMEAMDEYSHTGKSMAGNSMDSYMSGYSRGYSEARRSRDGDSDGRYNESYGYSGAYGYSTHDSKEHMINELRRMMQELEPREKQIVENCINQMQR